MAERNINDGFGKYLQKIRLNRGLTQERLAERCDISLDHLQNIEINRRKPSFDYLIRIMRAMNISFDDFVYPDRQETAKESSEIHRNLRMLDKKEISLLNDMIQFYLERKQRLHLMKTDVEDDT